MNRFITKLFYCLLANYVLFNCKGSEEIAKKPFLPDGVLGFSGAFLGKDTTFISKKDGWIHSYSPSGDQEFSFSNYSPDSVKTFGLSFIGSYRSPFCDSLQNSLIHYLSADKLPIYVPMPYQPGVRVLYSSFSRRGVLKTVAVSSWVDQSNSSIEVINVQEKEISMPPIFCQGTKYVLVDLRIKVNLRDAQTNYEGKVDGLARIALSPCCEYYINRVL